MNGPSNLRSSRARMVLFLFSLLEATAFYCNDPNHTNRADSRNVVKESSESSLTFRMASRSILDQKLQRKQENSWRTSSILSERIPSGESLGFGGSAKKRRCRCPGDDEKEPNDDHDDVDDESATLEDRREALFAAMGGLWAASSVGVLGFPGHALATAGVDANMAFPDVIGGMNDRATKQCLVESLGNRECMVYKETDPDKLLYKGVDAEILVARIQKAATALKGIPALVEKKKWNDINGLLIGPMGELSSTLTLLCGDDSAKTKLARKVKEDLFAIGTANTQRQQDNIIKYHAAATKDLAKFLEVAL